MHREHLFLRWLVCLSGALLIFGGCSEDEPTPTELRISITSEVAVDQLEILVRNRDYLWDRLETPLDKDITSEPFLLQLRPGRLDGEILLFVKGFADGVYRAGKSSTVRYKPERIVERNIRLDADFVESDADEDGFIRCVAGGDAGRCDCDDRDALVNPFSAELCGDGIDNDCSGGYPPDGSGCPCTEDIPCTNLDESFLEFAGIGACTLGVLRCVDGVLSDTCEGASPIRNPGEVAEVLDNFIDDDCDGVVDEGGPCDPALSPGGRVCHRGFVDDPRNTSIDPIFTDLLEGIADPGLQASFLARGVCAPGGNAPGRQLCDPTTRTWATRCEGDIRPQRPPLPSEIDGLETVDPSSFTGVGFVELRLPGVVDPAGNPIDQCDGADNNCDGSFDEAPAFDSDGDGYTRCGTPVRFPEPEPGGEPLAPIRDQPGLEDAFIDCNDNERDINPGAREVCGEMIDNDCFCDHGGESVVGLPRFRVDGTFNCSQTQAFLNCSLPPPRSDPTSPGVCGDLNEDGPVYYWGYKNNAAGEKACYTCSAQYGLSCSDTGACATKDEDCCPCAAFPEPGETRLDAVRPLCSDSAPDSCTCTTPAQWDPIPDGEDTFDDCAGFTCTSFYWGIEGGVCHLVRNAGQDDVACAGLPFCDDSGGDCCDPADPESCCQGPDVVCAGFVPPDDSDATLATPAAQSFKGAPDTTRPQCNAAIGGCFDQAPPIYSAQPFGNDDFDECNDGFVCGDEDAAEGAYYFGREGTPRRCYVKADVSNNACDGSGTCQDRAEACAAATVRGPAVARDASRICKIPTDGCSATTPPVYGQNVPFQTDPYDDCPGDATCCSGACCAQQGSACASDNQCDQGLSCVDGVCCENACDGACDACASALTGVPDGTCAPIENVVVDTVPNANLCVASGGCPNPPCICDGAGTCKSDLGATCSANTDCSSGFCVDGVCCENACTTGCFACSAGLTGAANGQCEPFAATGDDNTPANACAGNSGCGAGGIDCSCDGPTCKRGRGSSCSGDSECRSGFCVDGVCCNAACDGACEACTAALSTSAQDGVCANLAALATDPSPTTTCGPGIGCGGGSDCVCQPGTGNCVERGGTCVTAADCAEDFCVEGQCCTSACDGQCESCVESLTGVTSGTCAPITNAPDTQPTTLCSGSVGCNGDDCVCESGACDGDQGSACAAAADCHSGDCVDGVCCESACSGTCRACASSLTGQDDGLCRNIAFSVQDTEPTNLCTGNSTCEPGTAQCKSNDGESCSNDAQCLSGHCVDGRCCENACNTACRGCSASLTGGQNGECLPLQGSGTDTSPSNLCVGSIGCPGAASCECEPGTASCKNGNGVSCSSNGECLSGSCVDGVCCDTTCGDACDACNVSGSVGTCTPVPAGTQGSPVCSGSLLCDGGSVSCPGGCGGNDALCDTGFFCNGTACEAERPASSSCARDAECSSGFCVEGVCCNEICGDACESCLAARQGTGGSNGQCRPVADGEEGAPQCGGNLRCDGSARICPSGCVVEADCDPGFFCDGGSCAQKVAPGGACTADSECALGFCVDGVCCDGACDGECDSCSAALKGGGADGVCGATAPGTDPDGECQALLSYCVGGPGAADSACDTSCAPNDDSQCVPGAFCNASDVCEADQPDGDACEGPGDCQSGFCADGRCCNEACDGACEACSGAYAGITDGVCGSFGAGTDPDGECGEYFCALNGCNDNCEPNDDLLCKAGAYCLEQGGPANDACLPLEPDGVVCEFDGDCQSGFCADGVCCNDACVGECEACVASLTGGSDGTCAPIPDGTDPESECVGGLACNGGACPPGATCMGATLCDGASLDCEDSFYCDPAGACVSQLANGTEPDLTCVAFEGESCASGIAYEEAGAFVCCDGACGDSCQSCFNARTGGTQGACLPVSSGQDGEPLCDGGAYLCTGSSDACPTTCSADADCGSGFYCDGSGACLPDLAAGVTCDRAAMCASGNCVENVCCDRACDQTCESCLGALTGGPDGACAPVQAGEEDTVTGAGQPVCDSTGVGCAGTACLCTGDGAGSGECLNATGESCVNNNECWSDNCDNSTTNTCQP